MFEVLIGSRVRPELHPGRGIIVAAFHGAVVAGAAGLTAVRREPEAVPRIAAIDFVLPPPAPAAAEPILSGSGGGVVIRAPEIEVPPVPTDIPTFIPPATSGPVLDPDRLRSLISAGAPGPVGAGPVSVDRILGASEVDEPAAAIRQPQPRYPPALRLASIEGRVLVEFVIDTTGHIDPGSLRIVERTHQGFEAAALETLERSMFRPARVAGRPVRQRTLQSIAFRIRE